MRNPQNRRGREDTRPRNNGTRPRQGAQVNRQETPEQRRRRLEQQAAREQARIFGQVGTLPEDLSVAPGPATSGRTTLQSDYPWADNIQQHPRAVRPSTNPYSDYPWADNIQRLPSPNPPVPEYRDAAARMGADRLGLPGGGMANPVGQETAGPEIDPMAGIIAAIERIANGGGGGQAPYVDENLLARVQGFGADTSGLHDAAAEKIRGYYSDANRDMGAPFTAQMEQYQQGMENMGTAQYAQNDENLQLFDAAGRQLQETSDQNLATHLATVEKLKGLRGETFAGLETAIRNGWNPYDTGGGGNNNDKTQAAAIDALMELAGQTSLTQTQTENVKEEAQEEQVYKNPGLADAIADINDPVQQSAINRLYALSGGDPEKALQLATEGTVDANAILNRFNPETLVNAGNNAQQVSELRLPAFISRNLNSRLNPIQREIQRRIRAAQAAQGSVLENNIAANFFQRWSPSYGPQTVSQNISATGSNVDNTRTRIG